MGQNRESRGGNPLVGENLICDKGGISNHWGKCGIFDKSVRQWQSHMQKPDPYPPLKHKNKSPMDKRPVKISKENISIKARGKD